MTVYMIRRKSDGAYLVWHSYFGPPKCTILKNRGRVFKNKSAAKNHFNLVPVYSNEFEVVTFELTELQVQSIEAFRQE